MPEQEVVDGTRQLVVFQLENELYGADISAVREIGPLQRVTRVPHTPPYITGVTNLRGRVIPVIDLRLRVGLPPAEVTSDTRIVVAELEGQQIGMVVDRVNEVLRVADSAVEPPSSMVAMVDTEYLQGVAKVDDRIIILLDLVRVLQRDDRSLV